MKIYNKIIYDFDNNIIEEDYYEYNGPLTLANATGAGSPGSAGRYTAQFGTPEAPPSNNNYNGGGGGDNNNTITQVTQTAPTVAQVDQVTTDTTPTETAETTEANKLLKIKKKGRSASIISGSKGVTKTSSDYSLGKKSLLGRV